MYKFTMCIHTSKNVHWLLSTFVIYKHKNIFTVIGRMIQININTVYIYTWKLPIQLLYIYIYKVEYESIV
jgi:hypothetical protein